MKRRKDDRKKISIMSEESKQMLEAITGYELIDKAKELHDKISNIILNSSLPAIIGIAILESVKDDIFRLINTLSYIKYIEMRKKEKGGDE